MKDTLWSSLRASLGMPCFHSYLALRVIITAILYQRRRKRKRKEKIEKKRNLQGNEEELIIGDRIPARFGKGKETTGRFGSLMLFIWKAQSPKKDMQTTISPNIPLYTMSALLSPLSPPFLLLSLSPSSRPLLPPPSSFSSSSLLF